MERDVQAAPPAEGPGDNSYAAELIEALVAKMGRPAVLVGYSYGGVVALRTALRLEYFADPQGMRSSETSVPGANVDLWEVTATLEYKIWRGLVGRLEYRHDQANRNLFSVRNVGGRGLGPTSDAQNTITFAEFFSSENLEQILGIPSLSLVDD